MKNLLLPAFLLPASAVAFALLAVGVNTGLGLLSFLVFILGVALLWRPGEAPILLYIFLFQWIEASLSIFYADWKNLTPAQASSIEGEHELAILLTLIALLCIALGLRIGAGSRCTDEVQLARFTIQRHGQMPWLKHYALAWVIATVAQTFALFSAGLSQPLLALANTKWAFYFIFSYATFTAKDSNRLYWFFAFLIELVVSFWSYFSDFKTVFVFTLLALLASGARLAASLIFTASAVAILMLFIGLIWTSIKDEYRIYLSGGEQQQIVTVGFVDSIAKLFELSSSVKKEDLADAAERLVRRILYTEYFGAVLQYVPAVEPHAYGTQWIDAISRPFMPRLLFPDKNIIDETETTNKYTGLEVAGFDRGTQISIGYIGETYIDFGAFGMMIALSLYGFGLGKIYRWLLVGRYSRGILGMGLSSAVLMTSNSIGNGLAKNIGGIMVLVLVVWPLTRFLSSRYPN